MSLFISLFPRSLIHYDINEILKKNITDFFLSLVLNLTLFTMCCGLNCIKKYTSIGAIYAGQTELTLLSVCRAVTQWSARDINNMLKGYKMDLAAAFGTKLPTALLNFYFKHTFLRKVSIPLANLQ